MTLYRYATLNERDRWKPGPPPESGFRFYDEQGDTVSYFVPVVITEHVVKCFDCKGYGFLPSYGPIDDHTECGGCKGTGQWAVPVVVDRETE